MRELAGFLKTVGIIFALVWSAVAVIRLWDEFTDGGASGVLLYLLQEYEQVTGAFFGLVEPLLVRAVEFLSRVAKWEIEVTPYWKDVLALLGLYFGAQVSDYPRYPRPLRTLASHSAWAIVCALGTTIASGVVAAELEPGVVVVSVSVAGITIHRLGFGVLWAVNRNKYFTESFGRSFLKKASGAAVVATMGLLVFFLGRRLAGFELSGQQVSPSFLVLLLVLVTMSMFHIAPGVVEYLRKGELGERAGAFWIGAKILGTIVLALSAILGFG